MSRLIFAILASLVLASQPGRAQDIAAGRHVARTLCSGCHQVGLEAHGRPGLAPSFAKIARTKGMTRTAIETFLSTSHEVMPNYVLDPRQIRDVAAYIESLRGTASGT